MSNYIIRRLLLLPATLFCIILVNFIIINLAPGDPVTLSRISESGEATRSADKDVTFNNEDPYTTFREFYGLTLPILWNDWSWISQEQVLLNLERLSTKKYSPKDTQEMNFKEYTELKTKVGDQARFVMPKLMSIAENPNTDPSVKIFAVRAFIRGGTRQAYLGPDLSETQKSWNRKIAKDNIFLRELALTSLDTPQTITSKLASLRNWYASNQAFYQFEPDFWQKVKILFTETRFSKYFGRVITLDFGTLRNNDQTTVLSEVLKRMKYSLTLSVIPLCITFILCQIFGLYMALKHNRLPDFSLNILFLILFAIPVFVVAPFLIEKIAMNHNFPFTNYPIPLSGFTNPDRVYLEETSWQRLIDISAHLVLPLIALLYGSLATQSRLSRTAVLEVMKQDYVRTAMAKGLPKSQIYTKYIGRNAAVTIVTSVAGSLGVILGGSLIVETLFQINGFGRFFYEAIINRDYNVMMFSALAGSALALIGYLVADISYSLLDPRVTFE